MTEAVNDKIDIIKLYDGYRKSSEPSDVQRIASNPKYSVWLNASAGTGKTKVLRDRVVKLLLEGNEISTILCITFTNAGAAEMQTRIMQLLQKWALAQDEELIEDLTELYGEEFTNKSNAEKEKYLKQARNLFAKILDSPYGLRIETIHAFCQYVLKKFPIEAGVNPNFNIIDERQTDMILTTSYKDIISNINLYDISEAFFILMKYKTESSISEIVNKIVSDRTKFNKMFDKYKIGQNLTKIDSDLINIFSKVYDINISEVIQDYDKDLQYSKISDKYLEQTKSLILKNKDRLVNLCDEIISKLPVKEDKKQKSLKYSIELKNLLNSPTFLNTKSDLFKYCSYFLSSSDITDNNTGESYSEFNPNPAKILTKTCKKEAKIDDSYDSFLQIVSDEAFRIKETISKLISVEYSYAVSKFAYFIIDKYEKEKSKLSLLDYDDLIEKTVNLLSKNEHYSDWVLYKLDGGIKHILVDEAQDTSREQWEIVDKLTDGFFYTGLSEKDLKTIFVVGDRKQSIYSFQGANIDLFEEYHKKFEDKVINYGFDFKNVTLDTSFRTSLPVITLVNQMLLNREMSKGITLPKEETKDFIHKSYNHDRPGIVEIWPIVKDKTEDKNFNYWTKERVIYESLSSKARLAKLISKKIKSLIDNGTSASDIMILIKKRTQGSILSYLIKALTEEKVEIAGIDKLILTDNIIINDLIAISQITISDYDDLTLAGLLKSPFFGLDEEKLFDICYNRGNKTVFQVIQSKYPEIYDYIQTIKNYASTNPTPFEFYTFILNNNDNWKKIFKRTGIETAEIINEFLSLALSFEQTNLHQTGLIGFIKWISVDEVSIKRDMEKVENKVRIMTAHGAKGLESKIIFLPETLSNNKNNRGQKIIWDDENNIPYIASSFETSIYNLKNVKEKKQLDDESKRLLYVAITRAKEQLYVCGYGKKNTDTFNILSNNWYTMIYNTIIGIKDANYKIEEFSSDLFKDVELVSLSKGSGSKAKIIEETDKIISISFAGNKKDEKEIKKEKDDIQNFELPEWAKNISGNFDKYNTNNFVRKVKSDNVNFNNSVSEQDYALNYGKLIHKIFELLPSMYSSKTTDNLNNIIQKILNTDKTIPEDKKEQILNKLKELLSNNSDIKNILIAKNSLNELSISTKDNKEYRIDKLIIDNDNKEIKIIDYKTDSKAQNTDKEILEKYKKQLKTYKDLIKSIYKEYKISTMILWTHDFSISEFDL